MTRVTITETYAVGCPDCVEVLVRLAQWSGRDSQVIALNFKAVPHCDHALPIQKGKPEKLLGSEVLRASKPAEEQPIAIATSDRSEGTPPPPPTWLCSQSGTIAQHHWQEPGTMNLKPDDPTGIGIEALASAHAEAVSFQGYTC